MTNCNAISMLFLLIGWKLKNSKPTKDETGKLWHYDENYKICIRKMCELLTKYPYRNQFFFCVKRPQAFFLSKKSLLFFLCAEAAAGAFFHSFTFCSPAMSLPQASRRPQAFLHCLILVVTKWFKKYASRRQWFKKFGL